MDFAAAIEGQRAFFETGATRPLEFRLEQLLKLRHAIESRESLLFDALYADLRKPLHESYITEIGIVVNEIDYARRHLASWMKPQRRRVPLFVWPAQGFVQSEPYGVALIMGPWNYPFQLLLSPLVGAIAAGNCIVLKPSEYAPRTAAAIGQVIAESFPDHFITVVQGESDVAEALLRERFDVLFFTGSSAVGRIVMAAAARNLTPVTLELGGKCPCLVCVDAPLETTARRIAWGKFMNAGQTCVAPDYVFVDRRVQAGFVDALKLALREFYGDDPQKSRDYSRIVNVRHFDRLIGYLNSGQIAHGGQHNRDDLYVAPTVITGVQWDGAGVMKDEIFGPILPVLEFDQLDEALALLRQKPVPLALYLFTPNRLTQKRVLAQTRSGGVCLNDTVTHVVGQNLPFGGLGESGLGAYHGRASFDAFTHQRSVLRRSFLFDSQLRCPPLRASLSIIKRARRFILGG